MKKLWYFFFFVLVVLPACNCCKKECSPREQRVLALCDKKPHKENYTALEA